MEAAHAAYARADPLFYDKPGRRGHDSSELFAVPETRDWTMWARVDDDHWTHWLPRTQALPEQGWKIHVSTVPRSAATILALTAEFCHERGLAFKHVRSRLHLGLSLAKDADRGSAGKFITIYPTSDAQLQKALEGLDRLVGGHPGPYVLSDVRWRRGPLFVRYGAFLPLLTVHAGRRVPALRDPRTGALVPDVRAPYFHLPAWVDAPAFLQGEIDALADATPPAGFPKISSALHHSNAGGVYAATIDDRRIVLKEARPHSGWTPDGRDAVDRLVDEERTLARLPRDVSAPRTIGVLRAHGHRFLALEHVEGASLMDAVVLRNPLTDRAGSPEAAAAYRAWALSVSDELRRQVKALHAAGLSHGDLHPRNVVIADDGAVSLLDFEMSQPVSADASTAVGAPGFVPPFACTPKGRDEYGLACIDLFMFLPLTALLPLDTGKAHQLLRTAQAHFDLDERWVRTRLRVLDPASTGRNRRGSAVMPPPASVTDIARTLAADSDHVRDDRLWPGDPRQFRDAPYALGFGALGVGAALAESGVPLTEAQRDWICDALAGDLSQEPLGLMGGLAGAVWGCRTVGMPQIADDLLAEIARREWRHLDETLGEGIAGVALTLLSAADRHPGAERTARQMGDELGARLETTAPRERVATNRGGLFAGASGTALLALRLYETFGEQRYLELAEHALDVDLATLAPAADGSLHVNEGWRILPYLGYGSAGIGLVLAQFLDHTAGTSHHHATLDGIVAAAMSPFTVQAGLLHGRAGLIHMLAEVDRLGFGSTEARRARERHVAALDLHAIHGTDGALRFAGDGLLRASCDLASGAAGVLVALRGHEGAQNSVGTLSGALGFLRPFDSRPRRHRRPGEGGEEGGVPSLVAGAGGRE